MATQRGLSYAPFTATSSSLANGASITVTHDADTGYLRQCSAYCDVAAGDNAVLQLLFAGADASTTFTDSSYYNQAVTPNGNAQIDTAQFKWGSSSGLFDGTGDYLSVPASSRFDFGTSGDFTIGMQIRFNSLSGTRDLISHYAGGGSPTGWNIRWISGNTLRVVRGADQIQDYTWAPSTGTWYHLAITRASGTLRAFVEGTQLGSNVSDSISWTSSGTTLQVGRVHTLSSTDMNGWFGEVYINNGTALHTANFTAPTSAYSLAENIKGSIAIGSSSLTPKFISSTQTSFTNNTGAALTNVVAQVYNCQGA